MARLPKRTRGHALEAESHQFVKGVLPPEWIVESGQKDYGIDLAIEIVRAGYVTGAHFLMQLKATDRLLVRRRKYVAHTCKTSTLRYFLERPELIVYLVYDAQKAVGYWIWIQDYIRNNLDSIWQEQTTATIKIPLSNKFDVDAVEEISQRILKSHKQAIWMTALETARNPYFRYKLEITDQGVRVNVSEKYPGALKDHPITINGTFKFDQSPDGQASRQALESAIKTGAPVEIDSRFFEGFDIPDIAPELLTHLGDQFVTTKVAMGPAASHAGFTARISVLDQEGCIVADIPYIDFRVVQAGTEEITYSNEEQAFPLKILWRLNFKEKTSSTSMRSGFVGLNVVQVRDILRIRRAFAEGTWFQITNLATGFSVREELPGSLKLGFNETFEQIINNLAFVQEKTNRAIQWTGEITVTEVETLKRVVTILETGRLSEKANTVNFAVCKTVAQGLANLCAESEQVRLRFDWPGYSANLLGTEIPLGAATVLLPNARPTQATLQTFQGLDRLPDDETVRIDLDIEEPGAFVYYHEWLPKSKRSEVDRA
jgi:hypothetical protein